MTKPKTDFAEDDQALARRALWLLEGNEPGRQQPPTEMDLSRLTSSVGSDGFLVPLAYFGLVRNMDAIRAAPMPATSEPQEHSPNLHVAKAKRRVEAQLEACRAEKRANAQLREALFRVNLAVEDWQAAAAARADDWAQTPAELLTGEHQAILAALLVAQEGVKNALTLIDVSMRQLPQGNVINSFPSTLGMPKAERNQELNEQALRLVETGISLEMIAYLMGWDDGTIEQTKDRTRKRLEDARERRALARAD